MPRVGELYRCGANNRCEHDGEGIFPEEVQEQYDGLGIYAGMWHEDCWQLHGSSYRNYTREDAYANGERIGDEDY